ncbi:MAG: ATP-dependent DNA helicase RecG [Planctomycetes bacterium]|nr:ATP-dependent DNA helicase RecG [Planctomycetota bacterium]
MKTPLDEPVSAVKGVGPAVAERLAKLGITTVRGLLWHFPRLYQDRSRLKPIAQLALGHHEAFTGRVKEARTSWWRGRGGVLTAIIEDATGQIAALWFGMPYLQKQLKPGTQLVLWGKVTMGKRLSVLSPEFELIGDDEPLHAQRIVPIYPATAGIGQKRFRRLMRAALDALAGHAPEIFPDAFREKRRLIPIAQAIEQIHFPEQMKAAEMARRRLAYEEFFVLEAAVALRRRALRHGVEGIAFDISPKIDARIRRRFPFRLTSAQERAIAEIAADMQAPRPMNRLLQGDVGSGKTAVALYAMLAAVANRHQAALMAPTEILAEQHFRTIETLLKGSRVRTLLLLGGAAAAERRANLAAIREGIVDIVVGTHALIQGDVEFARLGLAVVDEQHKFGVLQRATLRWKGGEKDSGSLFCDREGRRKKTPGVFFARPDVLVMTATPIPRSLALTVFGDLDLSTLDEMPAGRQPITTTIIPPTRRNDAWQLIRRELAAGRQAYIVYPLVEEADTSELKAATEMVSHLQRDVFPAHRVGLLHGQMKPDEKQARMAAFRAGETHVLVATTVVEVGLDVPNATAMAIEHAEHYGLSQLHQLRGRIGRGEHPSHCLLLVDEPEASDKLAILAETTDGFRIAEEDLKRRGPGEFLGTRQHGLPPLAIGDFTEDIRLLMEARHDAFALVEADPALAQPAHRPLRRAVLARHADSIELASVG